MLILVILTNILVTLESNLMFIYTIRRIEENLMLKAKQNSMSAKASKQTKNPYVLL